MEDAQSQNRVQNVPDGQEFCMEDAAGQTDKKI